MATPPRKRSPAPVAAPPTQPPTLTIGKKLLFSFILVLAGLAMLEGAARLFVRVAPNSRWTFHQQLVDSVGFPALNDVMAPDPVLFWSLKPNLEQKVLSGRIAGSVDIRFSVSTDSLGTRRVPPVTGTRTLVAFLGDSCTFGVGVDDHQTFAALLQQRNADVRALNLGVPGYTAYQGHEQLARYPFADSPALVVVTFGFNDEAVWDNRSDLEHAHDLEGQRSWMQASRFMTVLGGLLRRPADAAPAPTATRRPRLTDDEFRAEIRSIGEWCRTHGAKPLLLLWPYRVQVARTDMSPKQRALLRVAAEERLPLVNLVPFVRSGGERLFIDLIHASAPGHEAVAEAVQPALRAVLSTAEVPAR